MEFVVDPETTTLNQKISPEIRARVLEALRANPVKAQDTMYNFRSGGRCCLCVIEDVAYNHDSRDLGIEGRLRAGLLKTSPIFGDNPIFWNISCINGVRLSNINDAIYGPAPPEIQGIIPEYPATHAQIADLMEETWKQLDALSRHE